MVRSFWGLTWGLIFIVVGVLMLLDRLGYLYFNLGHFLATWWPLALVIVGLGIIFDKSSGRRSKEK